MPVLDESSAVVDARRLLERYRMLCEANGLARAHRTTLAPPVSADLARLEQELLGRLGATAEHAEPARTRSEMPRPVGPATPGEDGPPPASEPTVLKTTRLAPPQTGQGHATDPGTRDRAVTVFTDGSAEGNPGPGGYCALVRVPGRPDQELSGGERHTTNNKMELTAAIVGLEGAIEAGAKEITVITDSEYLVKGMTAWLSTWMRKGWKTASGQPVKNQELWQKLSELSRGRSVRWQWVRGHAGHPENERCDAVATAAARRQSL